MMISKPHANRRRPARRLAAALALALGLAAAGCRWGEMYDQPRYDAYEPSEFFDDGTSARPIEPGTVPRGDPTERAAGSAFTTGRGADANFVDELPIPFDRGVLERGQGRYQIFCAPCHGADGAGRGMIVERGFTPPPALFEPKVSDQPLGYYFDVITQGHGAMYGYAARIPPRDRWAIAAYLRALQLSQRAAASDLAASDIEALDKAAGPQRAAPAPTGGEAHP
jgi:mono/diheme cytochrome c family protein